MQMIEERLGMLCIYPYLEKGIRILCPKKIIKKRRKRIMYLLLDLVLPNLPKLWFIYFPGETKMSILSLYSNK